MTIIFGFALEDTIMIISDILASSKSKKGFIPFIPTIDEQVQKVKFPNNIYPKKITQKTILIDSHLCIAFAGLVEPAKKFITQLIKANANSSLSYNEVQEIVKNEPIFAKKDKLAVIIYVIDNSTHQLMAIPKNTHLLDDPRFKWGAFAGSGSSILKTIISNPDLFSGITDLSNYSSTIFVSLRILYELLRLDLLEKKISLESFFGGAYEITCFDGKSLFKFQDYIIVFWILDSKNNKKIKYIYKPYYIRSNFLTTIIEMDGLMSIRNHSYLVPILKSDELTDLEKETRPSLDSRYLVNIFLTLDTDGKWKDSFIYMKYDS